ncbi:MAG: hypothetical protein CM15mP104_4370 [Gammaproteobacteria bacterium]|nr:MAG: hypothetical protein CM15mP104_4370 [Gammaproteobacteria bacterium]
MIIAANYARRKNIPYFGICLGMQIAIIEFARYEAKLNQAIVLNSINQHLIQLLHLLQSGKINPVNWSKEILILIWEER